uniref:CUB domain-containing protein n=1 Tax=Panagrellus redivivus TaxID=6233 RepID=A0A7E4USS9_PANRE
MFAQCVVLTTLLVAVQCFTIQQDPGTRECTDLICPKGAFAKIAHPLVDDDKRETQCTVCSQCTENGYSVCGTPLNKHPRLRRSPYTAGCSCANFVPEGCVIRWAAQNVKSSDTEAIHVCYLSTLRTPPQPEATPNENGTLLMLEAFWERPYWKEFNLTDLFLYIEFEAPGSGNSSSLETHSMQIDMSDDSAENAEPIPEYDPTDAAEDISEEDEPEYQPIQFNHDAFQGVNIVRFYYNVTAARPRQLNLRRDAYRIEDVSTSVSSESLIYNVEEAMDESDISDEDAEDDVEEDEEDAPVATSTKGPTTTTTAKTTTPATTEKPKQKPTVEMVNSEEFDESEEDDDDDILDEEDEEDPIDDGNTPVDDASEDDDSDDVEEDASTTEGDSVETTTYSSTESEESEEVTSTETSVEETTTGEGSTETVDDILLADDNINANETGDFFTKHLGGEWDLTRVCFVLAGVFSILLCIAACCYYYRGCCYSDQQKVVTKTSNGYEYHVTGNGQEMVGPPETEKLTQ